MRPSFHQPIRMRNFDVNKNKSRFVLSGQEKTGKTGAKKGTKTSVKQDEAFFRARRWLSATKGHRWRRWRRQDNPRSQLQTPPPQHPQEAGRQSGMREISENLPSSSSATSGGKSYPLKSPAYQPIKPFKIPFGMGTPHPKASVLPVSIDTPQVWPFAQLHFACFSLVPFLQLTCPKVFELTKSRAFNFALRSGSFFVHFTMIYWLQRCLNFILEFLVYFLSFQFYS